MCQLWLSHDAIKGKSLARLSGRLHELKAVGGGKSAGQRQKIPLGVSQSAVELEKITPLKS